MSSLLTERLPQTVQIDGVEVKINTDYRIFVNLELTLQDDILSDEEKIYRMLKLCYPSIPKNIVEALEQIMWFYSCGKKDKKKRSRKPLYRFDCDGDYIYSAFLSQYSIDLQELPYMHWWKFRSLFQSLGDDNEITKIIGYRNMEITGKMTNDQKRFYKRMKEQYKLPMPEHKSQMVEEIEEALINGGDINHILQR